MNFLFFLLSICLSICSFAFIFVCLSISPPFYSSACMFINLFIYLSECLYSCLSIYLSIGLSVYLPFSLLICLTFFIFICPFFQLSVCPSAHLSGIVLVRTFIHPPVRPSVRPSVRLMRPGIVSNSNSALHFPLPFLKKLFRPLLMLRHNKLECLVDDNSICSILTITGENKLLLI